MEFRRRASREQFAIIIDFMETHGDLNKAIAGTQGRLKSDRLWRELAILLNAAGGSSIQRSADRWKRVWSDWKTKTKKKASALSADRRASRFNLLNPLEKRVLKMIDSSYSIGNQTGEKADMEEPQIPQPLQETVKSPSPPQSPPPSSPAEAEPQLPVTSNPESKIKVLDFISAPHSAFAASNAAKERGTHRAASVSSSAPRRRRWITERKRRYQPSFEQATSYFFRIEEGRLRLEEKRIQLQHERDMAHLRVESERNQLLHRIADTVDAIRRILSQA